MIEENEINNPHKEISPRPENDNLTYNYNQNNAPGEFGEYKVITKISGGSYTSAFAAIKKNDKDKKIFILKTLNEKQEGIKGNILLNN